MAKVTVWFGVALVVVGVGFWLAGGGAGALHPAGLGVLLVVCGLLAENEQRRMLWMHIAVLLGVVGVGLTGVRLFLQLLQGTLGPRPAAVGERTITLAICLVFVSLCVRSFIAARKARSGTA